MDEPETPAEAGQVATESESSIILASFENRHAAERMLASLSRGFREEARKGYAKAFVIHGNKDGSLTLTQSRALSASGVVYTLIRIPLVVTIGFTGILSTLRGAKGAVREVHRRESGVGADEQAVHALLADVGPNAALVLVSSDDQKMGRRSQHGWPTMQVKVGMARAHSSLLASIRAASTTGCGPP
jgi:hypothetical protein